ncbi:MAG: hypothetical protein HQL73_01720 [Magnetococcales bacterium]|nr:hypothetical protein [Magnetococcales bacterium]
MSNPQRLHQMQIIYSQIADRMMLRINTLDRQEFRFWLTRRFVKRLWPGLAQTVAQQVRPEASHSPQARAAVMEMMHESAISQADFNTQFEAQAETTPMGLEPILISKARLLPMKPNLVVLALYPETGPGIELALDQHLLHALCKLLQDSMSHTDWDLKLQLTESITTANSAASIEAPINSQWKFH